MTTTNNANNNSNRQRYPLAGVRVLDMTVVWAGPYGTMFLADMGAEVIRVESVNVFPSSTRGTFVRPTKEVEMTRAPGASQFPDRDPGERPWNRSAMFNAHARNKYSMTVDLTTPEGKDIFHRLVKVSDVFIENNALGSMERLGFTYDQLSAINPGLVMISSTGMGQTGPWAHFRGYGTQFEALYGHSSIMGYPDMDASGIPGTVAADAAGGVAMSFAAVMGLWQRRTTGKGVFIDLSQGENFVPQLGEYFMDYFINGRVARTLGNRVEGVIQGAYPCTGDDEWITLTVSTDAEWRALCGVMERPDMAHDPAYATAAGRYQWHDEIDEILSAWTARHDSIALFHQLQAAGVTAAPILHEDQAYQDPQLLMRDFFVPVTHPEAGTHLYPSTAFKASKMPFVVRKPPVRLGEDNDYIYREVLRLSDEEYDRLKALGQIGMDYDPSLR